MPLPQWISVEIGVSTMEQHNGHRERMKQRYAESGLDNFHDINALELLLFYCIPRMDTNGIAHELISEYGNLSNVFNASADDLRKCSGVGENTVQFINLLKDVYRRIQTEKTIPVYIRDSSSASDYLKALYLFSDNEIIYLLSIDSQRRLISCNKISEGSVGSVDVSIRRIAETALAKKAYSVIISHNHPMGAAKPSDDDIVFTRRINEALTGIGVAFDDHIIIAGDESLSMLNAGYIK